MDTGRFEEGVLRADAMPKRFTNEINRSYQHDGAVEVGKEQRFLNLLHELATEKGRPVLPAEAEEILNQVEEMEG